MLHSGLQNATVCITWNINSSDTAINGFNVSIYGADTQDVISIHSNETKAILTLDYNEGYNISVTAVNCAGESKTKDGIFFIKSTCYVIFTLFVMR